MAIEASHLQEASSPARSGRPSPSYARGRGGGDDGINDGLFRNISAKNFCVNG